MTRSFLTSWATTFGPKKTDAPSLSAPPEFTNTPSASGLEASSSDNWESKWAKQVEESLSRAAATVTSGGQTIRPSVITSTPAKTVTVNVDTGETVTVDHFNYDHDTRHGDARGSAPGGLSTSAALGAGLGAGLGGAFILGVIGFVLYRRGKRAGRSKDNSIAIDNVRAKTVDSGKSPGRSSDEPPGLEAELPAAPELGLEESNEGKPHQRSYSGPRGETPDSPAGTAELSAEPLLRLAGVSRKGTTKGATGR